VIRLQYRYCMSVEVIMLTSLIRVVSIDGVNTVLHGTLIIAADVYKNRNVPSNCRICYIGISLWRLSFQIVASAPPLLPLPPSRGPVSPHVLLDSAYLMQTAGEALLAVNISVAYDSLTPYPGVLFL
jgi:hypothetical protein